MVIVGPRLLFLLYLMIKEPDWSGNLLPRSKVKNTENVVPV